MPAFRTAADIGNLPVRRITFTAAFDWEPPDHPRGRVTIAYKRGMSCLVDEDCAASAIAHRKAVDGMSNRNAGPIRLRAIRSWRNDQFEGDVSIGEEFSTTESRAAALLNRDPPLAERIVDFPAMPTVGEGRAPLHAPIVIVIPAWGEHYVNYATKYVLPSVTHALKRRMAKITPQFIIYTDMPERFAGVTEGWNAHFRPVPAGGGFPGLNYAHRETIMRAPTGSIVTLLNADIMVSEEAFVIADLIFARGHKVVASIGMRSLIQKEEPPIGASAKDLLDWTWRNRHPIAEDGVWGRGKTRTPTTIFFENGDNVVVHCFHLHPFMVHKDRGLTFKGTIDDDLLARYEANEIYVLRDREIGFAELSWREKGQATGTPLSVNSVVDTGRSYIPAHIRNFRNAIRVTGDGPVDDSAAAVIADGVAKKWNRK